MNRAQSLRTQSLRIFIVMPAVNEEKKIGSVLKDLKRNGYNDIVVIDDGSKDNTAKVAAQEGAHVYRHVMNMGYGAASASAMEAAFRLGADVAVAIDADGQHDVHDIKRVLKPIMDRKAEIVIGTRTINRREMPFVRRIGNTGLTFLTFMLFGVWTRDSQSGFRAITKHAWHKMNLKSTDFEYSSEMIKEIGRNKILFSEVPIHVIYSDYSQSRTRTHSQSVIGGFKTFFGMVKRRLFN